MTTFERRYLWTQYIMGALVAVYAVVSYLQWNALKDSNDTTKKTLEAAYRPWLTVIQPRFFGYVGPSDAPLNQIRVELPFLNIGGSQAENVKASAYFLYVDEADPSEASIRAKATAHDTWTAAAIGRQEKTVATFIFPHSWPIPHQKTLAILADVFYDDPFAHRQVRQTECWFYDSSGEVSNELRPCVAGNQ